MLCEKCGFEYEGEKCPVCEVNAETEVTENTPLPPKKSIVLPIIALCVGIASVVLSCIGALIIGSLLGLIGAILFILPAAIPGAAAIVLGAIGIRKNTAMGVAAVILGAASIIIFIVACPIFGLIASTVMSLFGMILGF